MAPDFLCVFKCRSINSYASRKKATTLGHAWPLHYSIRLHFQLNANMLTLTKVMMFQPFVKASLD